jgi:hypothetical protein
MEKTLFNQDANELLRLVRRAVGRLRRLLSNHNFTPGRPPCNCPHCVEWPEDSKAVLSEAAGLLWALERGWWDFENSVWKNRRERQRMYTRSIGADNAKRLVEIEDRDADDVDPPVTAGTTESPDPAA